MKEGCKLTNKDEILALQIFKGGECNTRRW